LLLLTGDVPDPPGHVLQARVLLLRAPQMYDNDNWINSYLDAILDAGKGVGPARGRGGGGGGDRPSHEICRRKHGGATAATYVAVGGAVELDDPAEWVSRGGVAGACATVAVERGAPLG
ncbi:hypothetical protein ACJX0J_042262, partial [Zea mays]